MSYRLQDLAEIAGGRVEGDADMPIEDVAPLDRAGPRHLSFLTNRRYRARALESDAGALLVDAPLEGTDKSFVVVEDPYYALARILDVLHPPGNLPAGIHPTAIVESDAEVDRSAAVGAYSVIGRGVRIGAAVQIHPHVVVGDRSSIGEASILYPHVTVYAGSVIGERCVAHAGVVIGSDGFGYAQHGGGHVKLQHAGRIVIDDDVEIGANTTLDRALLDETRIGRGTKIDNLVQVAHNVRLGRACLLISQSGIAGSTRLGDGVVLAGQVGVTGHVELGDGVTVASKSAVFKSVEAGRKVAGIPARDAAAWRRQQALVSRLDELRKRVERLEKERRSERKGEGE